MINIIPMMTTNSATIPMRITVVVLAPAISDVLASVSEVGCVVGGNGDG